MLQGCISIKLQELSVALLSEPTGILLANVQVTGKKKITPLAQPPAGKHHKGHKAEAMGCFWKYVLLNFHFRENTESHCFQNNVFLYKCNSLQEMFT